MSFSHLTNNPQALKFFAQLPVPGNFAPSAATPAAPPARVAAVKNKAAKPTPGWPVVPAVQAAPANIQQVALAQQPKLGNHIGSALAAKAMQALHAVKNNKWYVALPLVVGVLFMCFKALAFDGVTGYDLPPVTSTVAISTMTSSSLSIAPPIPTAQVIKAPVAAVAQAKVGKPPATAQAVHALDTKLNALEQQLARAIDKLQAQRVLATEQITSTYVAVAAPLLTASTRAAPQSPNNGPVVTTEEVKQGAAISSLALVIAMGSLALAGCGLWLSRYWLGARKVQVLHAKDVNNLTNTAPIYPAVSPTFQPPSTNHVAALDILTKKPLATSTTAAPNILVIPVANSPWAFGSFGLKGPVRDEMQDAFAHFILPNGGLVVVVADGVGGEPHGALAAQLAVEATRNSLLNSKDVGLAATLIAVDAAGSAIANYAKQNGIQYGLRTTLMVMVRMGCTAHYACLGDGGLFHIRGVDGVVTTLFQPQRDKAGYLLASLGPITAGQPLAGSWHFAAGDLLMSGTDGIWERTADPAVLASWLVQRMGSAKGDVQLALQNSLGEFVQIKSNGRWVADDNASIGCIGTGQEPAFLRPQQTLSLTQPLTLTESSYA